MKLLECIEQAFRETANPGPHEIRAMITALELTPEKVSPFILEPSTLPYGRCTLFQTEEAEAVLVHLPPGSQTRIHDHGASIGCAYIVEGEMINTIYRVGPEGYAYVSGEQAVKRHHFMYSPGGQIHQMSNKGTQRLLSFHVYTPRLRDMKQYYTYEDVLDFVI